MTGRYGIRGAPNTGEGKTFIKGGTPQMIDRHPERLIRGNDADVGGGESGESHRHRSTADLSAEQGQERTFALWRSGNDYAIHALPGWEKVEVVARDRAEKAEADNRALKAKMNLLVGALERIGDAQRAENADVAEWAVAAHDLARKALETVSPKPGEPDG